MKKSYTGINIQWPISQLIIDRKKTIETRTYALPDKYLNQEMLMIETPGKKGKFKARIVGIIKFTNSFEYRNKKKFYEDSDKHHVTPTSEWAWATKKKWGWEVEVIEIFSIPVELKNKVKGIVYTSNIQLN